MKHFTEARTGVGYGPEGIRATGRIFSLAQDGAGTIVLREECDGYYFKELNPEDAIALFQEAIDWVKQVSGIPEVSGGDLTIQPHFPKIGEHFP